LKRPEDYFTARLIEDVEDALCYGSRVSVVCKDIPDISGYVVDATRSSFTIEKNGKLQRVRMCDVLLFDFLDRST
jgi:hypothetical protein